MVALQLCLNNEYHMLTILTNKAEFMSNRFLFII